jgi:hypothetical protein
MALLDLLVPPALRVLREQLELREEMAMLEALAQQEQLEMLVMLDLMALLVKLVHLAQMDLLVPKVDAITAHQLVFLRDTKSDPILKLPQDSRQYSCKTKQTPKIYHFLDAVSKLLYGNILLMSVSFCVLGNQYFNCF